jgi:glutaredoxin
MEQIKVYTKKRCPYCTSAKIWLTQKDYQFEEISLDDAEILREF